ncbi:MAG: purine-nucleoside phosphorylase [Gemmatimonadota bacterium]|nr:purine-nucleoside phosphorylase [Gemmatimonadota bacterium]MDE2873065.1 purine-nucleoside phosphorylase [Gemmatimonadota bacterium]
MADREAVGKPRIRECANILHGEGGLRPGVHIVLGSGLGGLAERVKDAVRVPFAGLPGFPRTSVEGHEGSFIVGRIGGTPVLVQSGRFHYYEGVGARVVAAPVRVGRALGAGTLVLTNAVGGIRSDLAPGSIVLVDDHLNLMFRAPLAGPVAEGEQRFPDMSRPCDPGLMELAESQALKAGIAMSRGTYAAVAGPHFETPAEVRALRAAGADVVGMSAVPEMTVARAGGQRVLAFSVVTNHASGVGAGAIDHEEVMAYAAEGGERLGVLLERLVPLAGG